jgi:hypothetical protein
LLQIFHFGPNDNTISANVISLWKICQVFLSTLAPTDIQANREV